MSGVRKPGRAARAALRVGGAIAFALGWLGVFLPGLPTTIFWIIAALCYARSDGRAYRALVSRGRAGEAVRVFVEEGRISRRGKVVSIAAMAAFAVLGAVAIPPPWAKIVALVVASAGCVFVGALPTTVKTGVRPGSAAEVGSLQAPDQVNQAAIKAE